MSDASRGLISRPMHSCFAPRALVLGVGFAQARGADAVSPSSAPLGQAERDFAAEVARDGGPVQQQVLDVLAGAKVQQSILDAISRPPRRRKPGRNTGRSSSRRNASTTASRSTATTAR
jgi:hypothetical protein